MSISLVGYIAQHYTDKVSDEGQKVRRDVHIGLGGSILALIGGTLFVVGLMHAHVHHCHAFVGDLIGSGFAIGATGTAVAAFAHQSLKKQVHVRNELTTIPGRNEMNCN